MSAQTLRRVYFSIIEDHFDVVRSFLEVTGSSIRHVCAEFGIDLYHIFLLFPLHILEI